MKPLLWKRLFLFNYYNNPNPTAAFHTINFRTALCQIYFLMFVSF